MKKEAVSWDQRRIEEMRQKAFSAGFMLVPINEAWARTCQLANLAPAPSASPQTDEELVEAMIEAWDDAYEAEYFTNGTAKDNRATAMRAAFAVAREQIERKAREKALDDAAAVCRNFSVELTREAANFRGGSNPHHNRLALAAIHAKDADAILSLKDDPHDQP